MTRASVILWRRDHPRSRGEYLASSVTVWCTNGSSPLSRGIHSLINVIGTITGIIPALAGNTMDILSYNGGY